MIEQSKKLVNKLVKTSATVALVGVASFNNVVKAEETAEVKPVEATQPTEEATSKEPQNLAEAQALVAVATTEKEAAAGEVAEAEAAVAAQEAVIAEAQEAHKAAVEAEVTAQTALAEAEKLAAEATPEKIAEVTAELEAKTDEKELAATELVEAQVAATTQGTELVAAQTEVAEAQKAVEAAAADVVAAQAAIKDPVALQEQKAAAEKQVATLEQALATARQSLTTTTATTANAVTQDILTKEAEITRLNAEIKRLESEISIVNKPVDVTGGNRLVLPSNFPSSTIKELIVASQSRYTGGEANFNAVLTRAVEGIKAQAAQGMAINSYQDIAEDAGRTVDPANLSTDVQNELASFVAAMLNPVRQQLGLTQVEVVAGAQDFAKRLANHITSLGTLPQGLHDFAAIRSNATAVGLKSGDTFAYEALGMTGGTARTVNDLKAGIYYTLKMMIFEDHKWSQDLGHTLNLLRNDAPKVYLGVGTSTAYNNYGYYNQHIMMVPSTNVVNTSLFKTTPVSAVRQYSEAANNGPKITALRNQIASLQADVNTLKGYQANPATHPSVAAANQRVNSLTSQLTVARTTVGKLASDLASVTANNTTNTVRLNDAKNRLTSAKARQASALTNLEKEQAESTESTTALTAAQNRVATLTKEVDFLTELLAKYNQPNLVAEKRSAVESATARILEALDKVEVETEKLPGLNQTLAEARAILEEKQKALSAAQAILAKFYPGIIEPNRDFTTTETYVPEKWTPGTLVNVSTLPVVNGTPSVGSFALTTRELIHAGTGVRVTLRGGEDKITALRVTHKETNDATTPATLGGQDYDLFDIETVDAAGNFVQINQPATVTLPVDAGKHVTKVIYLPNSTSQEELPFAETVMLDKDGNLTNAVRFTANHFSEYAIVYAAGQTVSQATQQVLTHKPATAATAAATVSSSVKTLPNTGDKASLVATVLGTMLLSGAALKGFKRQED